MNVRNNHLWGGCLCPPFSRICPALILLLLCVCTFAPTADLPPFAFAVIGDSGCGCPEQRAVADAMMAWYEKKPFAIVLMLGDNIYGEKFSLFWWRPRCRGGDKSLFRERFDQYYQPLLDRKVQFFAALGNHDLQTNQGKDEIDDVSRFHIGGDHGYYSVPVGPKDLINFFALNSNTLVDGSDFQQLEWLKKSLQQSPSVWKIVFSHHPLYSAPGGHKIDEKFRKVVEPVLVKGRVQIAMAGHNHFYARMKPQQGITYFVAGGGGRDLKKPRLNAETVQIAKSHHFLYFEVYPEKIEFSAVSPSGAFLDQGSIQLKQ